MKVIVMGCGRVGEQTARMLADDGHQVTVIDYDATALARLGPQFKGRTVQGVGFDRAVLIQAGIENADAFAATSSMDNINIVAARIAHNYFHVPKVVARLFDPQRAEIYRRLGLITISSTTWGAERIRELLTHAELDTVMTFGRGEVVIVTVETPPHLAGRMVKHVTSSGETSVVVITRQGEAIMPTLGTEFHAGDIIHMAVHVSAMDRVEALFGLEGGI